MIAGHDLLRVYLRSVMGASGARAASLFIPSGLGDPSSAILIHEGDGPAVPELSSLEVAAAFSKSVRSEPGDGAKARERTIREVTSSDPAGLLITTEVFPEARQVDPPRGGERRTGRESSRSGDRGVETWIGLLGAEPAAGRVPETWRSLMQLAGVLASHARDVSEILDDPLTGLAGRAEFEHRLGRLCSGAESATRPRMLLLVNPDDFGTINETYGPERGDEVLRLLGTRLRETLRASDLVARYGGAIFVALIDGVDEKAGTKLAQKVLDALSEVLTLAESFRLTISAGAACIGTDGSKLNPGDLIRRAERALTVAKCAGGDCLRFWDPAHESGAMGELDELSGVFTGNPSKNYRNMKLLSRTVTAIASSSSFDELTSVVVSRIHSTLKADRVALVDWFESGGLRVICATGPKGANPDQSSASKLTEDRALVTMLEEARDEGRPVTAVSGPTEDRCVAFAIPLIAGDAYLGTLYVDGHQGRIALDSADVEFLQALASQLALALDRARLSQVESEWRETERQHLRAELDELRQAIEGSELVYESPQMHELMATARRVAQTDATVLICGESGTGKELISRTLHDLSLRKDKPFVVVDCASIPTTLIESELFGHERGAYTGAQDRKAGRLKEAHTGTVVLDEIGELPLEVQGKLLRFVQEKQLTTVGGNRVVEVDARVVAATNRNLEDEVRDGRFREDLFHRLNVIRLEIPPLRMRPQDILALVSLYLRQFSLKYQHGNPRRLTQAAEARVQEYRWPGNVRELQNRIMQAVILSRTEEIGPDQLGLPKGESSPAQGVFPVSAPSFEGECDIDRPAVPARPPAAEAVSLDDVWDAMATALADGVSMATAGDKVAPPPLFCWLTDDLVVNAYVAANQVMTRGADILGIPEATFRRKLHKAQDRREAGLVDRPESWNNVSPLLAAVVRSALPATEDLLKRVRNVLLGCVIDRAPSRRAVGAALMGVTEPTFRRWVREISAAQARPDERQATVAESVG